MHRSHFIWFIYILSWFSPKEASQVILFPQYYCFSNRMLNGKKKKGEFKTLSNPFKLKNTRHWFLWCIKRLHQFQLALYSPLCGCQSSAPSIMRRIMEAEVISRCPAAWRKVEVKRRTSLKKSRNNRKVLLINVCAAFANKSSPPLYALFTGINSKLQLHCDDLKPF